VNQKYFKGERQGRIQVVFLLQFRTCTSVGVERNREKGNQSIPGEQNSNQRMSKKPKSVFKTCPPQQTETFQRGKLASLVGGIM